MGKKFFFLLSLFTSFFIFIFSYTNSIYFPLTPAYDLQSGEITPVQLKYKVIVFNAGDEQEVVSLRVYNSQGKSIGLKKEIVNPLGTWEVNLEEVPTNSEDVSKITAVKIEGENLKCVIVERDVNGDRIAASWVPDTKYTDTLDIGHVATLRDLYFTAFSVSALTDSTLTWDDFTTEKQLFQMTEDETKTWELFSIYGENTPEDVPLAQIRGTKNSRLYGFESFGRWDWSKTFSIIPISSFRNRRLIFPHIAYMNVYYWTGLVVSNPNSEENKITIRFISEDGEILQTQHTTILPNKRIVFLFAGDNHSSPPLPEDIPDGTAWIDVFGEKPLTGFELFGGNDLTEADYMEGIRATGDTIQDGVIPYIAEKDNMWTGVSIINTLSLPIHIQLTLRSKTGETISTKEFDLSPFQKKVDFLRNWFSWEDLKNGGNVTIHASQEGAIAGIVVFGDENVSPRRLLGGYEIVPLNDFRTHGPKLNQLGLPRFGVNCPKFSDLPNIAVPSQEKTQQQYGWWASGQPYRMAMRHMVKLDVYYDDWIEYDEETKQKQERLFHNEEGISVMPSFGLRPEWNGPGEPSDPIDMNDPSDVSRLENYVRDVINTYPDIKYYEMFNETFGKETLGMGNFAKILDKIIEVAKSIDPEIKLSFPHLLGTTPDLLKNACDNLVLFSQNFPTTAENCDSFGIHYYGPWDQFDSIIKNYLLKPMEEGKIPQKPWTITEAAISSSTSPDTVTALNGIEGGYENQAAYLVKVMTIGFKNGAQLFMHHSFQSASLTGGWAGYGLIDNDGTIKKAGYTFRYFTNAIRDFTEVKAISEGEDNLWIYRFVNADNLLGDAIVIWSGDESGRKEEKTLNFPLLAGCRVKISNLVPNTSGGNAGENPEFNEEELFNVRYETVDDSGNITVSVSKYPILIKRITRVETTEISLSDETEGQFRDLQGVIAGPAPGPPYINSNLTEKYQSTHITSVRNNDFYDDSLDVEGIFRCPDNSVYPSWNCDANDDSNYHWDLSDWRFSTIVDGGFEPFLRLGGEMNCDTSVCPGHYDFRGPRENQEDNWITAAIKIADRYVNWNGNPCTVKYLDIWTEWPNKDFWDRDDNDFIFFWAKAFREIKSHFPQCKVGGPGILKPTVDVIEGITENNKAYKFLKYLYNNNIKPDWIGFHLFSIHPRKFYKAAVQFRNLLDGTGDFSNVPWAGSDFFKDVEIICDAYDCGSAEMNENGEMETFPDEFLDALFNQKDGTAYQTSQWISLQKGGVVRAYYYRGGDTGPSQNGTKVPANQVGLFDYQGNPKPVAHAFRLRYKLNEEYPDMLKGDFYTRTDEGNDFFFIGGEGEKGYAILVANFSENPVDFKIKVGGIYLTPENFSSVKVYQVDNENDGTTGKEWNKDTFHIPARCVQLIEFLTE